MRLLLQYFCSHFYEYPAALNADYGEPLGLCQETGTTGVFTREYTKSTIRMDCNKYEPLITFHPEVVGSTPGVNTEV